jgi:hypothetical protein
VLYFFFTKFLYFENENENEWKWRKIATKLLLTWIKYNFPLNLILSACVWCCCVAIQHNWTFIVNITHPDLNCDHSLRLRIYGTWPILLFKCNARLSLSAMLFYIQTGAHRLQTTTKFAWHTSWPTFWNVTKAKVCTGE